MKLLLPLFLLFPIILQNVSSHLEKLQSEATIEVYKSVKLLFLLNGSYYSQDSSLDFLNHFPEYKWEDIPEDILNIQRRDSLDAEYINRFMFGHLNTIEKFVKGNDIYSVPSPHIILKDGSFGKGIGGQFSNESFGVPTVIQPLAKVYLNENIVLLYIFYKTRIDEKYEVYTYRIKDHKLLSSLRLYTTEHFNVSFKNGKYKYEVFRELEYGEGSLYYMVNYKLNNDGYFQEERNVNLGNSEHVYMGYVNDPDGYSNVREEQNASSNILYTVNDNRFIIVAKNDSSEWNKVLLYYDGPEGFKSRNFYRSGYIHSSRIKRISSN